MDNFATPIFYQPDPNRSLWQGETAGILAGDQLARKLGGHLNIKTRDGLGTRYSVHIKMLAADPEVEEEEERLLDNVCVMVDVLRQKWESVTRQLESRVQPLSHP
ncbi:hypothetical protein ACNKHR_22720 [Shigella flexneri]